MLFCLSERPVFRLRLLGCFESVLLEAKSTNVDLAQIGGYFVAKWND